MAAAGGRDLETQVTEDFIALNTFARSVEIKRDIQKDEKSIALAKDVKQLLIEKFRPIISGVKTVEEYQQRSPNEKAQIRSQMLKVLMLQLPHFKNLIEKALDILPEYQKKKSAVADKINIGKKIDIAVYKAIDGLVCSKPQDVTKIIAQQFVQLYNALAAERAAAQQVHKANFFSTGQDSKFSKAIGDVLDNKELKDFFEQHQKQFAQPVVGAAAAAGKYKK